MSAAKPEVGDVFARSDNAQFGWIVKSEEEACRLARSLREVPGWCCFLAATVKPGDVVIPAERVSRFHEMAVMLQSNQRFRYGESATWLAELDELAAALSPSSEPAREDER